MWESVCVFVSMLTYVLVCVLVCLCVSVLEYVCCVCV